MLHQAPLQSLLVSTQIGTRAGGQGGISPPFASLYEHNIECLVTLQHTPTDKMQPILWLVAGAVALLALFVRAALTYGHRTSNMPHGEHLLSEVLVSERNL